MITKKHINKLIFLILGLIITAVSFNSCKEDIELVGSYKETAVIYALLDQSESIHFLKINRAFIGPGNALEIAKIPDSSYFKNLEGTITEYMNDVVTNTWNLKDTLVDNKSTNGIFYAPTQKLYYFKGALNDAATYKLSVIVNKNTTKEFEITGETKLVTNLSSAQSSQTSYFRFFNTGVYKTDNIKTTPTGTGSAFRVNATLGIDFYEYDDSFSVLDSVSLTWNAGESEVQPNSSYSAAIAGQNFYELIRDNVTNNPLITHRQIKSITIRLTGGSEDFNTYINSNKPSSSLAQTKPNFTNLSVTNNKNVIGIFSARQTVLIVKPFAVPFINSRAIDSESTKELCTGAITGNLFFCSGHNLDSGQSYHCP